jgi:1,2-diacylglycerol 3-alpha-glucosyltransferase
VSVGASVGGHRLDTIPSRPATTLATMRIAHFSDLGHQNLRVVPRHPDQAGADDLPRVRSLPRGVAQYRMADRTFHH